MQASVFGKQRLLPEMSAALHLESGILGKCRLSVVDDGFPVIVFVILLAFFLYGISF